MPLFAHAQTSRLATIEAVAVKSCMFCDGELMSIALDSGSRRWESSGRRGEALTNWLHDIRRCARCGWWVSRREQHSLQDRHGNTHSDRHVLGSAGCLKQLDITAPDAAIDEIRAYLMGRYESRLSVDFYRFEEVVASVYEDLGYQGVVTNHSGDDGIDVFLRKGSDTIGVQVKRFADAIDVAYLRDLSGSLTFHGITKGIFVTTSRFTSGAPRYLSTYQMRGQEIELVDADAFYSALEIAQVTHLERYDEEIRALADKSSQVLENESRKL
jgi:restriction system protein